MKNTPDLKLFLTATALLLTWTIWKCPCDEILDCHRGYYTVYLGILAVPILTLKK